MVVIQLGWRGGRRKKGKSNKRIESVSEGGRLHNEKLRLLYLGFKYKCEQKLIMIRNWFQGLIRETGFQHQPPCRRNNFGRRKIVHRQTEPDVKCADVFSDLLPNPDWNSNFLELSWTLRGTWTTLKSIIRILVLVSLGPLRSGLLALLGLCLSAKDLLLHPVHKNLSWIPWCSPRTKKMKHPVLQRHFAEKSWTSVQEVR